jgi:hypothetical protein
MVLTGGCDRISGDMARLFLILLFLLLVACNAAEISRLQKENQALRRELDRRKALADLDTQAKCAAAAKQFFREEYTFDKDTMSLDERNHYNNKIGHCLVSIEWHFKDKFSKNGSWFNMIKVVDAYQRDEFGNFLEYTEIITQPPYEPLKRLRECTVDSTRCKSIEEFNSLLSRLWVDADTESSKSSKE